MSLIRQTVLIPDSAEAPVVGVSSHWPSRSEKAQHTHSRHQLMYSRKGVIHVSTPTGVWILPPDKVDLDQRRHPARSSRQATCRTHHFVGGSGRSRRATLDRLQRRKRLPAHPRTVDHLFGAALGLSSRLALFASRAGSSRTTRSARAGSAGATRVERPKSRAGRRHAQSRSGGSKAARRVSGGGRRESQDDRTPFRFRDSNVFRQMARAASNDHRAGAVGARG
jgi:hypothetical protein